jgi:hypothetical protein
MARVVKLNLRDWGDYKMEPHIFQQYSQRENVATNNTLFLLSLLNKKSPELFHKFLSELTRGVYQGDINFNMSFTQQQRQQGLATIPDAQISRSGFKILVEAKENCADFDEKQIKGHLEGLKRPHCQAEYRIMLTLSPEDISPEQLDKFKTLVYEVNEAEKTSNNLETDIHYIHITFSKIISTIDKLIDDQRDFDVRDLLDSYIDYCSHEGYLPRTEYVMRAVPVSNTFDDNLELALYTDNADRGFSGHRFIALYKDRAIRAVGEIVKIVKPVIDIPTLQIIAKTFVVGNELTTDEETNIVKAVKLNNDISTGHVFFLVEKFYPTEYEKITSGGLQGKKFFYIDDMFPEDKDKIKNAKDLAGKLNGKKW